MFTKSAQYYDELYAAAGKDYAAEATKVHRLIQKHAKSGGNSLLDVACGTGRHAGLLAEHYRVEGLDLDPSILAVARRRHPHIRFHRGDMADFRLARRFDAVICLFSAIGYVRTRARLRRAVRTMAGHLRPGGVLLVEPWFAPGQWHAGRVTALQVDQPGLKIVRMSRAARKGSVSILEFEYLIGTSKGIEHASERHALGLFEQADYRHAFRSAGLKTVHDARGLDGRGLYIGVRS